VGSWSAGLAARINLRTPCYASEAAGQSLPAIQRRPVGDSR
jgi:hypothetical protein